MTETVVEIRRYPNRRFYDRSRARYVTLQDIEALVLEGKTVEIRDSRNNEDMTRQILTQILMERHPHKMDLFPVAMLHSVLRANDLVMELWRGYLRQSMSAMTAWQKAAHPFAPTLDWVSAFMPGAPAPPPPTTTATTDDEASRRRDDLAKRLDELSARIERLESSGHPHHGHAHDKAAGDALSRLEQRVEELETTEEEPTKKPGRGRRKR